MLGGMITGCSTMRSLPPQPQVTVPDSWGQALHTPASATGDDLSQWWTQLDDPTLSQLITEALAANPGLRIAQANLREARARRSMARADLFPTVTASLSRSSQKTSSEGSNDVSSNHYSAGFDASWEPDIFGATSSAVRASRADEAAVRADLHDTQVSLVAEVALNYVELRAFQARLAIARDNLSRQEETLQLTSWRAQAGLTTELDVEQARSNAEQTRAAIPTLATGLAEAEHRLAVLLGKQPAALHSRLAALEQIPVAPTKIAVGIPADTLRQRPDVRAAGQRLVAATARLDEAKAARYPSLKLSGSIGLDALTSGGLTSAETVVSSLLANLTAPILNRSRINRQVDIASAAADQALASYEQTILRALEDVQNALVALDGSQQRQDALTTAVAAAESAAELARTLYSAGQSSYQSVLDTERSVLALEDSLSSTEAESASALIRLYKALGGGWSPTSAPVSPLQGEAS